MFAASAIYQGKIVCPPSYNSNKYSYIGTVCFDCIAIKPLNILITVLDYFVQIGFQEQGVEPGWRLTLERKPYLLSRLQPGSKQSLHGSIEKGRNFEDG